MLHISSEIAKRLNMQVLINKYTYNSSDRFVLETLKKYVFNRPIRTGFFSLKQFIWFKKLKFQLGDILGNTTYIACQFLVFSRKMNPLPNCFLKTN